VSAEARSDIDREPFLGGLVGHPQALQPLTVGIEPEVVASDGGATLRFRFGAGFTKLRRKGPALPATVMAPGLAAGRGECR
jgi:hypothetical protein